MPDSPSIIRKDPEALKVEFSVFDAKGASAV